MAAVGVAIQWLQLEWLQLEWRSNVCSWSGDFSQRWVLQAQQPHTLCFVDFALYLVLS
jgi:hypothetical protein